MKTIAIRILVFLLMIQYSIIITGQFPDFEFHKIGETGEIMLGQSSVADIDKDGDMDLIVGASGSTLWWFEYENQDAWIMHEIGKDALTDKGGVAVDVDGDGNTDQISGGTWYKNPGVKDGTWQRYENGSIYAYDNIVGDLNKDGKPELVSLSPQEGIFIYFFTSDPVKKTPIDVTKKWKSIKIDDGISGGISPQGIGDIDGDGDMDIVRSNVWYDNINGNGTKWEIHRTIRFVTSTGEYANSSRVFVFDMDSDGDMDIVQSECNNPNSKIAWHENKDGKGLNWFTHLVDENTQQDLHSLCVADFDNDGDMDIFSGGGPLTQDLYKQCFIWENSSGTGEKWIKHKVLNKIECFNAVSADIDGDGDIDICGKTWKDDEVYFLKNLLIENKK